MKIHNNMPVGGKATPKTGKNGEKGTVFQNLLETEIQPPDPIEKRQQPASGSQPPVQEAWSTLEESVSLLDEAMQCIEAGDTPPRELINDIENLRSLLKQQVTTGLSETELQQADTLLAVEAERIRSLHS